MKPARDHDVAENAGDIGLRVRPGNSAWNPLARAPAVEPANKLRALQLLAAALSPGAAPAPITERVWFQRCITEWAVSTGSSLESVLGLKRSGIPGAHTTAHLAARNAAIRHVARALPGPACITSRAHHIAAIIRGVAKPPTPEIVELVRDLKQRYTDLPRGYRQNLKILKGD